MSKKIPSIAETSTNLVKFYDEERLQWRAPCLGTLFQKLGRVPRLSKATALLLIMDLSLVALLLHVLHPFIVLLSRNREFFQPDLSLSSNTTSNTTQSEADQKSNEPTIPRILHQTCANETVPTKWMDLQQSCKDAYSDYKYMFWTDESAREFLSGEYPWFLETWDNYHFPIQRADSIRYFVLHHYGGLYLDMDTLCNAPLPLQKLEPMTAQHIAMFESTLPTGVTNDIMISSARHPAFTLAISQLPRFYSLTWFWASLLPYCNIMMSSGPLFLSLMLTKYLREHEPSVMTTIRVTNQSELAPFITDLESKTWHRADATALMWLGERPWTWFSSGAIGLIASLWLINRAVLAIAKTLRNFFHFAALPSNNALSSVNSPSKLD